MYFLKIKLNLNNILKIFIFLNLLICSSAYAEVSEYDVLSTSAISCQDDAIRIDGTIIADISSLFINDDDCLKLSSLGKEKGYLALDSKAIDDTLSAFLQFNRTYVRPGDEAAAVEFSPNSLTLNYVTSKLLYYDHPAIKYFEPELILLTTNAPSFKATDGWVYSIDSYDFSCSTSSNAVDFQAKCKLTVRSSMVYGKNEDFDVGAVRFDISFDQKGNITALDYMPLPR